MCTSFPINGINRMSTDWAVKYHGFAIHGRHISHSSYKRSAKYVYTRCVFNFGDIVASCALIKASICKWSDILNSIRIHWYELQKQQIYKQTRKKYIQDIYSLGYIAYVVWKKVEKKEKSILKLDFFKFKSFISREKLMKH